MYKQLEYLRESVAMTRGATYREDLPETGLLSGLFLKVSAPSTSGATLADELWRLQDHLGTLEIIGNGATVIKSADWKNFAHIHFVRQKTHPLGAWRNYATNTQFEYLLVLFGRKLWDPEFGLDLSRWDNVEFRLTNSSSATYHGSDPNISILQCYLREHAGGFRGFLRTEKWREWSTVADETKYFVLPTEFPIGSVHLRALMARSSGVGDTSFENLMDDIDFSLQGGTRRVYKGGIDDLALVDYYDVGSSLITAGFADVNADRGFNMGLGRILGSASASGSKDGAGSATIPTIEGDRNDGTMKPETREADSPIHYLTQGYAFQNSVSLWHSPSLAADEMLDPAQAGEMRLNIHTRNTSASAGGTNQVILERLVA